MTTPLIDTDPIVTRAHEPYVMGETEIRLLCGTHTGSVIGAIDYIVGPGFGPPPILHRHTREDAGWLVLDGEIEFTFGSGDVVRAGAGDSVVHPRGCWFRWKNASSDRSARAICWFAPAGFEQYFTELAARAKDHLETGGAMEDFAPTLNQLRRQYGNEIQSDAATGMS